MNSIASISATQASPAPRNSRYRGRNLVIAAIAGALFLLLGGGAIVTSVLVLSGRAGNEGNNAPPPHYIFRQERPQTGTAEVSRVEHP